MRRRLRAAAVLLAAVVAACGGPIAANPTVARPTPPPTPSPATAKPDPQPISLPADDAAHHRLTEWWYYTGHLTTADGHRYGFEFVIFRAERGPLPVTWASHVALTDETDGTFHYAQRTQIGPQVDLVASSAVHMPAGGIDFAITGAGLTGSGGGPAWQMSGLDGKNRLHVELSSAEASKAGLSGLSFDLAVDPRKPPVLHNGNGWIDFGEAGGSYYYSRTSLAVSGTLAVNGKPATVTGEAWFDHQWGDFIAVGGGWDWFAVNLADGTDITLSLVRAPNGTPALSYGTLVDADGTATRLIAADFTVTVLGHWTSPATGATYPAGWRIGLPGRQLQIELHPTVADQELNTRASSGVVYWEGSQRVTATESGKPLGGEAYVELTGYATTR